MRARCKPSLAWRGGLLAATGLALLAGGCAKRGGHSAIDNSMNQSGVYEGRNSGPDAANTGGPDGAGGAPVGTSVPNSMGSNETTPVNNAGPH